MVAYSFKARFVDPIKAGLGLLPPEVLFDDARSKRQTIRAIGRRRHARAGETVQLYIAMRTKQCRKIGDGECVRVDPIRIHVESGRIAIAPDTADQRMYDKSCDLDAFAQRDGFGDWAEMREFWRKEHGDLKRLGPFVGVLIQWSPFRARAALESSHG
jgi:hypothetical protein